MEYLQFSGQVLSDELSKCLHHSNSQIWQDVHSLVLANFEEDGYFVEFGSGNGITGSNTYIQEKHFNWKGIVAEPARIWHEELKSNRSCWVDTRCVWTRSGDSLEFEEVDGGYLSGLAGQRTANIPASVVGRYSVETVSLNELLDFYEAPQKIQYLSIDTEGTEYDILREFDFNRYRIEFVTCEHNQSPMKDKLRHLFRENGYERLEIPWQFEDWYVRV